VGLIYSLRIKPVQLPLPLSVGLIYSLRIKPVQLPLPLSVGLISCLYQRYSIMCFSD
jgi:hypothetical protein